MAAALLASACGHAYVSGEKDAQPLRAHELVLRPAREIYAPVQADLGELATSAADGSEKQPSTVHFHRASK